MDKTKSKREYRNVCLCKSCKEHFLFTEAMARKISFGMTDKICPYCGSSQITFVKFADSGTGSYLSKFIFPV